MTELDRRKELARSSMAAYREAGPGIEKLLGAYVKALGRAGADSLALSTEVASDGTFRFDAVPQGPWLLVARQSLPGRRVHASRRPRIDPRQPFVQGPIITSHSVVSFWLIPEEVRAGIPLTVELTDRNIWHTGVLEETSPASGR
jgi:hypothetical protein